jgi:hypothetical protein
LTKTKTGTAGLSNRFPVVYYESINRASKITGIYECRCDERLQTKTKEFTLLPYIHWVGLGTGKPKDRDEVNK